MIIVTGGFGFIGSNLIQAMMKQGLHSVVVVDDLTDGRKFINLATTPISDYVDKTQFFKWVDEIDPSAVNAVFHLGACSDTTEWDGKFMMENNFQFSKDLFEWCCAGSVPLFYASSASVYGLGDRGFSEDLNCERPINVYGFSKWCFDNYVRTNLSRCEASCIGFRFFNVFGPNEQHKSKMASVLRHWFFQAEDTDEISIFGEYGGVDAGEHQRDFVSVNDCVSILMEALQLSPFAGILNLGSGVATSYNELGQLVITWFTQNMGTRPQIRYVQFPASLRGAYQTFTKSDMTKLRQAGFKHEFRDLRSEVFAYLDQLKSQR